MAWTVDSILESRIPGPIDMYRTHPKLRMQSIPDVVAERWRSK